MNTILAKPSNSLSLQKNLFTLGTLRNAIASSLLCLYGISSGHALAAPTLTEFTLNSATPGVSSGSFSIGYYVLHDTSHLSGSGYSYNFVSQLFTPSTDGNYTFGVSSSPNDAVLVLYQGNFNPLAPADNALRVNDDSDGLGAGGVTMGICGSYLDYCPKMSESLTASTDYYVVITTYSHGVPVNFPVGFYVYGEPVGVGGAPALSVLGSAQTYSNKPAFAGARVIDATPELLALFAGAGLTGDRQVSNAASQTLPLLVGGSQIAARNTLSEINRIVQSRIEVKRGLASGDSFQGDKNIWLKPFYSRADQSNRNGVTGFDAETTGMVFGLDAAVNDELNLGVAFAYAKANIDSNSKTARQSLDVDVYQLIGYGSYALDERSSMNFQLDFGKNQNSGTRRIAFTGTAADANYDSQTAHIGLGIDRIYPLSEQTSFVPEVRVDYTWIKDESYREKGADLLNLKVNNRTTEALVFGVGGTLNHALNQHTSLSLNLGVGYDAVNDTASITSAYAGAAGASFTTRGIKQSPWLGFTGAGLTHTTQSGTAVTLRYDAEHRSDFLNHTASLQAKWMF